MKILKRINMAMSIAILAVCCFVYLLFGWSGTGWRALTIPTGSMRPAIPPGSLVFVHRVPVSSLKVGDVITYTSPANPKTTLSHRIIKSYFIAGKIPAFVTKGDANKLPDQPIVGGMVLGKVVWHVPDVGWALLDAKKPIVILPIVYIAALLIMIEEVQRLRDYYKLSIPYRVPGFSGHNTDKTPNMLTKRISQSAALTATFIVASAAIGPSALAALSSNTVSLTDNRITVAAVTKPPTAPICCPGQPWFVVLYYKHGRKEYLHRSCAVHFHWQSHQQHQYFLYQCRVHIAN